MKFLWNEKAVGNLDTFQRRAKQMIFSPAGMSVTKHFVESTEGFFIQAGQAGNLNIQERRLQNGMENQIDGAFRL